MGLFSFFKRAGSKALVNKEKEAEKSQMAADMVKNAKITTLKSIVDSMDLGITGLEIDIDDDVIIVEGTADSHADREKVILTLGNVDGIATVDDRIYVAPAEEEEEVVEESQFYTVQRGDSLSKIAKNFYGDPMKYKQLFEANKPMLKDPNLIYPGQNLRIPKEFA